MTALLEPLPRRDWNVSAARHLLNRAGFGAPHEEAARLAGLDPTDAVDHFVDYERYPQELQEPDWLKVDPDEAAEREALRLGARRMMNDMAMDGPEKESLRAEFRRRQAEFRREQREQIRRLQTWWFRRMLESPRPLEEKMTLFWHGHFATSAEKVRSPQANYDLHALFRSAATGNFKLLTYEVGCSPAMMLYLDNATSRKEHPNENWARELMELYTLGQGRYTEDDIKAAARAFTGWSTDGESFAYRASTHDSGEKSFMGHRGNLNGQDILDIIFARPEAAEFIAVKLWEFFAYENPEPEIRRGLAQTLYRSGYELKPLLRRIFMARAFHSDRARGARIKSPVELLISMVDVLRPAPDPLVDAYLVFASARMSQNLFHAPNVKGWPGGRSWISAGTLMSRYNASNFLAQGLLTDAAPPLRQMVVQRYRDNPAFRRSMREARLAAAGKTKASPASTPSDSMDASAAEAMMAAGEEGGAPAPAPLSLRLPEPPSDARAVFSPYDGLPVDRVVEALADRLCVVPLNPDQLRHFARALGAENPARDIFDSATWPESRLRGTLHLMMSTAEFQLC